MLIDTHCHIQFNAYQEDADRVIQRCRDKNMKLLTVGSQRDTSKRAVEYAEKYPEIFAAVGLHPTHLISVEVDEEEIQFKSREEKFDYDIYKELASHPKVVAIGECGLDLFHLPGGMSKIEALKIQSEVFRQHHKLASELELPLIIHVRNAHEEMVKVLGSFTAPVNGVVHCFTSDWQTASQYLQMGLYIGITGIITFPEKKSEPELQYNLIKTIENCPLEKILIETDAPYLAPQAYRGQRAEPWMVEEVAKKIAEIKDLTFDEVVEISSQNALKLFKKMN